MTNFLTLHADPTANLHAATKQYVDGLLSAVLPVGSIMPFAGPSSATPSNWLFCNGSLKNIAAYPLLYAVIGTTYGADGSPATQFAVPDLRAEFLRGLDEGRGIDTGRTLGSTQGDALRNITGSITNIKRSGNGTASVSTGALSHVNTIIDGDGGETRPGLTLFFDASSVVPTASENRPRSVAVNYIIFAGQ